MNKSEDQFPELPDTLKGYARGTTGSGGLPMEVPSHVMDLASLGTKRETVSPNVTVVRKAENGIPPLSKEHFNKLSTDVTNATKEGTIAKYNAAARSAQNKDAEKSRTIGKAVFPGKERKVISIDSAARRG